MSRTTWAVALLCAAPSFAAAQANAAPPAYPPPQQPQAQQPPPPQPAPPQAPAQQAPPPAAAPAQGTGTAQQQPPPGTAGSQQVVVNPPSQPQPPPPPSVNVTPPPTGYAANPPFVVQREERRSSLEIVAIDAAYGAVAGLLVGGGVALIAENDNWGRDLMVGTGAGIILGAAVGAIHAYRVADQPRNPYAVRDGLGTLDKNPPNAGMTTVFAWAGRF